MISERIDADLKEIISEFRQELLTLEGKKILITGGNGFLPSYLVDIFIKMNASFTRPIELYIINKNPINERSRLSHLINNDKVHFITADVGKSFDIPEGINIIIHAASRANPKSFLADPIDTIDANVFGIRNLLDYAKKNSIEQFIFFSSAEIYGNPVKEFIPTPEHYPGNIDCLSPHACYIEAKRFSETLAMAFYRQYNIPVKFLRILLAYGPGIRNDGKVISDFFNYAIKEKKIQLRDKGEARRSFSYVSDSIRQILAVLFRGKFGEAYNIGDDTNNVSILELANMITEIVDNGSSVNFNRENITKEIYGVDSRYPDISKVKNLGVGIKVGLKNGLGRLYEHYKQTGEA